MNGFSISTYAFLHKKRRTFLHVLLTLLWGCFCLPFFSSCTKTVDYFSYVSELRNNVFLYKDDHYSLRVHSSIKESPYLSDGVVNQLNTRTEIRLIAPSGEQTYSVFFSLNETEYGGEMSFDNVKSEYYYACPVDVSACTELSIRLVCGTSENVYIAKSVLTSDTLTPKQTLDLLVEKQSDFFNGLTDKYGFAGEIHLRLLYEETPYYYVGVTDRNGNATAFLINAITGQILAKRPS